MVAIKSAQMMILTLRLHCLVTVMKTGHTRMRRAFSMSQYKVVENEDVFISKRVVYSVLNLITLLDMYSPVVM